MTKDYYKLQYQKVGKQYREALFTIGELQAEIAKLEESLDSHERRFKQSTQKLS